MIVEFASLMSTQVHAIEKALSDSAHSAGDTADFTFQWRGGSRRDSRLRILLEASDGDAEESFQSLQDAVAGAVEKPQLDALSTSINDFDFEAALLKLDEIAKRCARNGDNIMNQLDQKKTVLVVDDAPANIQIVNSILKDIYKIRIATNGAKALELAKATPSARPDPAGCHDARDGWLRSVHAVETRPRDAGYTGHISYRTDTIEEETRGFDVGAVDYIHKPFSPAVVKARVQTHLVLRGIREQLAQQLLTIQKELETARQIQLSILPSEIPKIEGLDIAARYVPMTSVAGDFYDFIVVDEKHIGILVADVSGHGMPAALIASMLKIALSAQAAHAADPAQVLLGLNQALCGKFQHHFVTAAYLFVDMQKRTLTYAGAGHPPLLLWGGSSKGVRDVGGKWFVSRKIPIRNLFFCGIAAQAGRSSVALHRWNSGDNEPLGSRVWRLTPSSSFWRRSKAPPQIILPINYLRSCPAGQIEARPKSWMTI